MLMVIQILAWDRHKVNGIPTFHVLIIGSPMAIQIQQVETSNKKTSTDVLPPAYK
jgi:hypothetical protein